MDGFGLSGGGLVCLGVHALPWFRAWLRGAVDRVLGW